MELLQEAGFHPLEVIRGATYHAAETLAKPKGQPIELVREIRDELEWRVRQLVKLVSA